MPSPRAAMVAILFAAWSTPCPADASPGAKPDDKPAAKPDDPAGAKRDQPPELKLKLGHYSNSRRGIGLVFDRSTAQAKVRFDGTTAIVKLDRQHGAGDRIDYIRSIGHVVLSQWDGGRVVVFIAGADEGIDVRRDGDADPL